VKIRKRPGSRNQKGSGDTRHALWFILKFVGLWLAFTMLLGFLPQIETKTVNATVWTLRTLLSPFRSGASGGDIIDAGGTSFQIVTECTSLMPTLILWSAILAFPAPWGRRVRGLAIGAAALWIYNLVRILALLGVMALWPSIFEAVHVYVWQTTTLAVVAVSFFLWLRSNAPVMAPRPA
jgi:exosortase/archaeosortase family protein